MTEITAPESVTVTDAQVDEFFNNEGSFAESPTSEPVKPPEPEKAPIEDKPAEEKKVNLGALHEERQRRKSEQERANKLQQERDELMKRIEQMTPKQENDDDPLESMRKKQEMIERVLIAQANSTIQQTENQKYWGKVKESELAFKQDKPDFDDAIKYLAETRKEELKDLGWSDEEAAKVLADEVKWISDKAYADEVNPAERFYALAKRRGFKAPEPVIDEKDTKANDKLDTIKKIASQRYWLNIFSNP